MNKYTELWEDLVSIRALILALVLCVGLTMTGYFIAPGEHPMPLFFGLGGALMGFIISSVLIEPKRIVEEGEVEK